MYLTATNSTWYSLFMEPVVSVIANDKGLKKVLDIGTGSGTLPRLLVEKNPELKVTGIDINPAMIGEAKKRFSHSHVLYQHHPANKLLAFPNSSFDIASFCSVIFLTDHPTRTNLISEALRILKPGGKIIVLTPSGNKPLISSIAEVWRYPFSLINFTFVIWKTATSSKGSNWKNEKWLERYAKANSLNYESSPVFNDNAILEILYKH